MRFRNVFACPYCGTNKVYLDTDVLSRRSPHVANRCPHLAFLAWKIDLDFDDGTAGPHGENRYGDWWHPGWVLLGRPVTDDPAEMVGRREGFSVPYEILSADRTDTRRNLWLQVRA